LFEPSKIAATYSVFLRGPLRALANVQRNLRTGASVHDQVDPKSLSKLHAQAMLNGIVSVEKVQRIGRRLAGWNTCHRLRNVKALVSIQ
jgi:hypothetical protein